MNDDEVIEVGCKCCDSILRMSRGNAERIARAVTLRHPPGAHIDISLVPRDIDLTGPVSAADIARVARLAVRGMP